MQNFIVGFIYFVYFVFLSHNAYSTSWDNFLFFFSKTGLYFAIITVLWSALLALMEKYYHPKLQSILHYKSKIGITVMVSLLLSHLLALFNPLQTISVKIAEQTGWHQNLYLFIFGLIVFILGLLAFKRSNKKTMIVGMMLLFIHGVYLCVLWNSLYQQKNVYEEFYVAAAKNSVTLTQCEKIACAKLQNENQIGPLFKSVIDGQKDNLFIQSLLSTYLHQFENKIKNSKDVLITYSYGDGPRGFVNSEYVPIGVYNKKDRYLIIDYSKLAEVVKNHDEVYKRITGIAALFWFFLLFLMIGWHHWLKERRMKNAPQKEVSNA